MWVCMCVDDRGDGLEVYIFCCDGLCYGFSFLTFWIYFIFLFVL